MDNHSSFSASPTMPDITATLAATARIKQFLSKRGGGIGVRIGVKTSGCSGLAYKLEFADSKKPDDLEFETDGVKLLIDNNSFKYLMGTELDYTKDGLQEGFKFNNPNVKAQCGCGESFSV